MTITFSCGFIIWEALKPPPPKNAQGFCIVGFTAKWEKIDDHC